MNSMQAYHFVGLDIHKCSITFCEKTAAGRTVAHGTIPARRDKLVAFAQSRSSPFVAGIEATLFSGWVYDVLLPYAVELHVGHPARLKALSKHKNDRIEARGILLFVAVALTFPRIAKLFRHSPQSPTASAENRD